MGNGYDIVLSGKNGKYSKTPILLKMYKNPKKEFMRNIVID